MILDARLAGCDGDEVDIGDATLIPEAEWYAVYFDLTIVYNLPEVVIECDKSSRTQPWIAKSSFIIITARHVTQGVLAVVGK